MGHHPAIDHERFPAQGQFAGTQVRVCFNYDTAPEHMLKGLVVRDDAEEPGHMIIMLEDGRYVLSTECMFQPVRG